MPIFQCEWNPEARARRALEGAVSEKDGAARTSAAAAKSGGEEAKGADARSTGTVKLSRSKARSGTPWLLLLATACVLAALVFYVKFASTKLAVACVAVALGALACYVYVVQHGKKAKKA